MALPAPPGLSRCISFPGHPTTWSDLESRCRARLGDNYGLPRKSSCPSHSIPCISCGQGLQLQPRVLTRQAKFPSHSHSAGGRDCEALPPSAGGLAQLRPSLLCRKVFRKLHLCISDNDIQRVVSNRPGVIESILCALREKMEARTVHVGSAGTAVSVCTSIQHASLLCLLPFALSQTIRL